MKKNKYPITYYIECDCHTELLQLEYDKDTNGELYISYYSMGKKGFKLSLRDKLRHIWKIIKDSTPYSDQICLNPDEICKLYGFLKKVKNDLRNKK